MSVGPYLRLIPCCNQTQTLDFQVPLDFGGYDGTYVYDGPNTEGLINDQCYTVTQLTGQISYVLGLPEIPEPGIGIIDGNCASEICDVCDPIAYEFAPCCAGPSIKFLRTPGPKNIFDDVNLPAVFQYIGDASFPGSGGSLQPGACYTVYQISGNNVSYPLLPEAVADNDIYGPTVNCNNLELCPVCPPAYYTLNDCCSNEPYKIDGDIIYIEYDNDCEPGVCPLDLENLVITEILNEAGIPVVGCFNITNVPAPAPTRVIYEWIKFMGEVTTVPTCAACQSCNCYTLYSCTPGVVPIVTDTDLESYVDQFVSVLNYEGCYFVTKNISSNCPDAVSVVLNLEIPCQCALNCYTVTGNPSSISYVNADLELVTVVGNSKFCSYIPPIVTGGTEGSVFTFGLCIDEECPEICYDLTNCQNTETITVSNSEVLTNYYVNNKVVTLMGYEGCWSIDISGNCDCLIVEILTEGGTNSFQANKVATYNERNVYEILGEDILPVDFYIWWDSINNIWVLSIGGYGEDAGETQAECLLDVDCPISDSADWTTDQAVYVLSVNKCPVQCDCAVNVSVLKTASDCISCLPIVAYKFINCKNSLQIKYSTEDFSDYVGKVVQLDCGDCWIVEQIDYTPPNVQLVNIDFTFDSCLACERTYYKLTDCLNPNNVTYTYTDLSSIIPPPIIGCDCISVTYTLVGEDPVTVEVESSDIVDGKNFYIIEIDGENYPLRWYLGDNWWYLDASTGLILSEDTPCPFGTYTIEEDNIFSAFSVTSCGSLPVIKIKGCDNCFTVEETREPINAGIVTVTDLFVDCPECLVTFPCRCSRITNQDTIAKDFTYLDCLFEEVTINLQPNETSDKVCLINWVLAPEEEALAYIEHFGDCTNNQCPVEQLPKRKVKPGYSTPTCDIEKYEKITCKSSEIYYKQVMRLRYGISNCCPEDEEKWLVKKELIDLDALRDPNYICKPTTSCCNQPISDCGCGCNTTLKTCNS